MRYFEAECLDGNNLVGYGRFNPDHITAVEQFKTMEKKKMEHLQGMYKSNPTAFAEWKELCMSKGYLSDIFGTLENPKEFDEEKLFAED